MIHDADVHSPPARESEKGSEAPPISRLPIISKRLQSLLNLRYTALQHSCIFTSNTKFLPVFLPHHTVEHYCVTLSTPAFSHPSWQQHPEPSLVWQHVLRPSIQPSDSPPLAILVFSPSNVRHSDPPPAADMPPVITPNPHQSDTMQLLLPSPQLVAQATSTSTMEASRK